MKKLNDYVIFYLKGFLMGTCDLIPGISGGTIAFITGIYERLIDAIKNITPKNYFILFMNLIKFDKKNLMKNLKKFDVFFLMALFAGILSAIFLGAKLISFLLTNYFVFLITFFIGLILSSSILIFKEIEEHTMSNYIAGIIGVLFGLAFLFLSPLQVSNPSLLYIIFGGFMGIFALFLPGISGSFILLILGLYEFMINAVKTFNIPVLLAFVVGALMSFGIVSRVIHYLFKKDKHKTLYFLFGLILGTLMIPLVRVFQSIHSLSLLLGLELLVLFLAGIFIVFLVNRIK